MIVRFIINDFQLDLNKAINELYNSLKTWNLNKNKIEINISVYPHFALGSNHAKYIVVDQKKVLITGANVQKKNDFNDKVWHDTGYLIEGDIAKSILADFDQAWNEKVIQWDCKNRRFQTDCKKITKQKIPERTFENNFKGNLNILTLTRDSRGDPNNDIDNPMTQAWILSFEKAVIHINIETPNINDDVFRKKVIEALKRGIKINLLTNFGFNASTESLPSQGGKNIDVIKSLREKILKEIPLYKDNFKVKWYSKDGNVPVFSNIYNANHTKYMSVDDSITIVGSGNMDTQSWNHSRELNILIDDESITKDIINKLFKSDWEKGIIVD